MCWIGHLQLKIAQEDIPIFKILSSTPDGRLTSIYRYYTYTLNKEAESLIIAPHIRKDGFNLRTENYISIIDVALHSYSSSVMTTIYIEHLNTIISKKIVKVRGIIPKGSQYCQNYKGEYISDRLILQKIEKEL